MCKNDINEKTSWGRDEPSSEEAGATTMDFVEIKLKFNAILKLMFNIEVLALKVSLRSCWILKFLVYVSRYDSLLNLMAKYKVDV